MENKLTPAQLTKLVGEVERISQRQQDELNREQVQDILRELNLPPELLDEAMIQLQRQEALAVQQRRDRWIIGGAIASLMIVIAIATVLWQQHKQVIARVSAQEDHLTLATETGKAVTAIDRQSKPEVIYNVTLNDAPVGQKLSLSCDWLNPKGQVVKQNHFETKSINTPVWETHCRYQLGSNALPGNWQVRLRLSDRQLSDATFAVK